VGFAASEADLIILLLAILRARVLPLLSLLPSLPCPFV
jgi:hypothetical protein